MTVQDPHIRKIDVEGPGAPAGEHSSVAVVSSGDLVLVAGQVPVDADGATVGAGDIEAQADQVLRNLRGALAGAGATLDDVCKLTTFVTSREHLPGWRAARRRVFSGDLPVATAVVVAALARDEWLIEVEAVAAVRPDGPQRAS